MRTPQGPAGVNQEVGSKPGARFKASPDMRKQLERIRQQPGAAPPAVREAPVVDTVFGDLDNAVPALQCHWSKSTCC